MKEKTSESKYFELFGLFRTDACLREKAKKWTWLLLTLLAALTAALIRERTKDRYPKDDMRLAGSQSCPAGLFGRKTTGFFFCFFFLCLKCRRKLIQGMKRLFLINLPDGALKNYILNSALFSPTISTSRNFSSMTFPLSYFIKI